MIPQPEANKKVSQDLQGIFGATGGTDMKNGVEEVNMKKKRSSGDAYEVSEDNSKKDEKSQSIHEHANMLAHTAQKKRKRDASDPDDEEEVESENGMRFFFFPFTIHSMNYLTLLFCLSTHAHAIFRR